LAAVYDYVRIGGRITFVGISIGHKIPVELGKIQSKSLTIKGTIGSAWRLAGGSAVPGPHQARSFADSDALLRSHQGNRSLRIRKGSEGAHQGDSDQRSLTPRLNALGVMIGARGCLKAGKFNTAASQGTCRLLARPFRMQIAPSAALSRPRVLID
jgi:hypothetical protein